MFQAAAFHTYAHIIRTYWWLSKLWSLFWYPKYEVPYYNKDPKRDHNFDNHPDNIGTYIGTPYLWKLPNPYVTRMELVCNPYMSYRGSFSETPPETASKLQMPETDDLA